MMERNLYENTVIRSLLTAAPSTVGRIPAEIETVTDANVANIANATTTTSTRTLNVDSSEVPSSPTEKDKKRNRDRRGSKDGTKEKEKSNKDDSSDEKEKDNKDKSKSKSSSSSSSKKRKGKKGRDEKDKDSDSESDSDDSESDDEEILVSTDIYSRGSESNSVSLKHLLNIIKCSYFHSPEVDMCRTTFINNMDKLRTVVRRLEVQGECEVSMSITGEPCVRSLNAYCGNTNNIKTINDAIADTGTGVDLTELVQAQGVPLKMRKNLLRRKEEVQNVNGLLQGH